MPTSPQPTAEALAAAREWMHSIPNPFGPDMHGYAAEICLRRAARYRAQLAEMEGGIDD